MQIKVKNFNLKDTITCGQIFRYNLEDDNSYTIILKDRVINIKQDKDYLYVDSNNTNNIENIVKNYFDINRNYENINNEIIKNNKELENIVKASKGFRIINQDPFETLIAYIISANNNVASISKSLNLISEKYGKKIIFNNKEYYLFPNNKDLSEVTKEDFRTLKVGFRDKYLENIIKKINNNELDLNTINNLSTTQALNQFISYPGIGMKIASCILLFAYQKFDVFPIDTWVKKYMATNYQINNAKSIEKFAKEKYGKYSGLVIQYIFHYNRNLVHKTKK